MAGRGDNLKGKTGGPVDVEPLRRAITGCVRSIAGDSEVEVSFSNDRPGLAGERVRLPEISKRPTAQELAVTRGLGDSMALRIACHDTNVHASLSPQGADARSVFDAVEQARVESIGALRMTGMASNIESMNAEKYAKANFSGIERQEDAPLAEAMAMMVREKLAGTRTPASAGKVLDLWRPFIEEKAGPALDNLKGALEDQQAFAKLVRNMLSSMQMAEDLGDDESEPEEMDNPNDEEQPRSNEAENEEVEEEAGSDAAPSVSVIATVADLAAAADLIQSVLAALSVSDAGASSDRAVSINLSVSASGRLTVTFTVKAPSIGFSGKGPSIIFN